LDIVLELTKSRFEVVARDDAVAVAVVAVEEGFGTHPRREERAVREERHGRDVRQAPDHRRHSGDEQRRLRAVLRTPSASQQQALRARIVLRAAEGATNTEIAAEAGVSLPTVGLWRRSFSERGLDGLRDAPRSGRPREIDDDQVQRVLALTLEPPPDGTTQWSVRRLAAATGLSATTVHRIWREHKLKPHQVRSFKFSHDPRLAEKVIDLVGLYLDPPEGALVLCVDEKSQIQALDRTQPGLPMKRDVFTAFSICGALAGLAGFMFLVRFGNITVTAAQGLELQVVAAVVAADANRRRRDMVSIGVLLESSCS
jgi:transposase